jgi:hypothetical protein
MLIFVTKLTPPYTFLYRQASPEEAFLFFYIYGKSYGIC